MKKILKSVLLISALLLTLLSVSNVGIVKAADITDETGWSAAYPNNNQNDYLQDQQTGSGSVSQDIVGDETNPSTYTRFSETEMDFRIRVNDINGTDPYEFKNFAFIGIDADLDGGVDFFIGLYNPTGNNGRLGIYLADPSYTNTSPSTTGIDGAPEMAFQPVDGENYSITDAGTAFSGTTDYFISFKFSVADIAEALQGTGVTFTASTPFRFMTGTAAQDNSFNQDLNGMNSDGFSSDDTWDDLDVFSDVVTADGDTDYSMVSFDKNTGDTEADPKIMVVETSTALGSLPAQPSKRGMYFVEWNTAADGTGTTIDAATLITGDITAYAIWTYTAPAGSFVVTFDHNNGTGTLETRFTNSDGNVESMPADPALSGSVFSGWLMPSGDYFTGNTYVDADITVVAQYVSTSSHSATFYDGYDASGGDVYVTYYSNNANGSYNEKMPSISRDGYTFDGWYSDAAYTTLAGAARDKIPKGTGSYYAKWTEDTTTAYIVNFIENNAGSTTVLSTKTVTDRLLGTLPTEPTVAGKQFIEWNRLADGSGEAMYPTSGIFEDTDLYAIWEDVYNVTFNSNGGTFDDASTSWATTAVDNQLEMQPQPPARDGYSFMGWGTTSTSTTPVDLLNTDYTVVANQTLYAIWVPIYTVTFNENYGATPATQDVPTAYERVLYIPSDPTRTGYNFVEWATTSAGGTTFTIDTSVTSNTIVYAQWNAIPVAVDDETVTAADTSVIVSVLTNDTDADVGDTLAVSAVTDGANGTVANNGTTVTYTPAAGFTGTDTFTYTVSDGHGGEATATVTVYVGVNAPPTANDDTYATTEDVTLNVPAAGVLTNDIDIDGTITAALLADAANGTVTMNADGSFDYVPNAGFNGTDTFTYTVTDDDGATDWATVTITVAAVNDTPVAVDDAYTVHVNTTLTVVAPGVLINDTLGDAPNAVTLTTGVTNGTLTFNADGSFVYVPNVNYLGADSFTYTITDFDSETSTATVNITMTNTAPVAVDNAYSTNEDTALVIPPAGVLGNDTDADGDTMISVKLTDPANGTLALNPDGSFTYTPNANFHGVDSFTYKANDGIADSASATVTITVNSVNDAPVAADDSDTTDEDTAVTVNVAANDTDADGDALTVSSVTAPSNGGVTFAGGTVTYTPNPGFYGSDTFDYTISDGNGGTDTATVTITVDPTNVTVTYANNDGTTDSTDVTETYGDTYGLTAEPTRTGYTFTEWNTASDGSGDTVTSATVVTNAADHTLYAQWTANSSGAPATTGAVTAANPVTNPETNMDLDWADAVDDVTAQSDLVYEAYYSENNNLNTLSDITANGTLIGTTTGVSEISAAGLTPGTTYYFNVIVTDEDGNESIYTAGSNTTPIAAPVIDEPVSTTTTTAILDWNNVDGASGYTVYDSAGNVVAVITGNTAGDSTYTVTGLTPGTDYEYYVVANGTDADSAHSNTVTATTQTELISIELTPESAIIQVGATLPMVVTFNPDTAAGPIAWTSSNPAVATVNAAGVVTGIDVGKIVVTATSGGASDTSIIEVQSATPDDPTLATVLVEGDLFYVPGEIPVPDIDITMYSTPLRGTTDANGYFYLGYGTEGAHTLIAESSPGTEIGRIPVTLIKGVSETYILYPDGSLEVTYNDDTDRIFIRLMITGGNPVEIRDVVYTGTGNASNPPTGDDMNMFEIFWHGLARFFQNIFG